MDRNAVQIELSQLVKHQMDKQTYYYTLAQAIPNNQTYPVNLAIEGDAHFLIEGIAGSVYGPTNANGVRQTAIATSFPLAGTSVGHADRGVTVSITDEGSNLRLTSGFVPLELILTPGYGLQMGPIMPFKYLVRKNSNLKLDFRNRDATADYYHYVSLLFVGKKYRVDPIPE